MKKLAAFASILVLLFGALAWFSQLSKTEQLKGNAYGTDNLKQSTIDQLDDPNYQNIILPDALKQKIESGEPLLVYFFSPECSHCVTLTPKLMTAAKEKGVRVEQMNVLEFDNMWDAYRLDYTPTLSYFKGGKEIQRLVGEVPEREIDALLDRYKKK